MEVNLSSWQTQVWDDNHRYKVINCGRRAGKSTITALKAIDFANSNIRSNVWYVAPTYKQAKSIMWEMINEYIPKGLLLKSNETELKFVLRNGSQIYLKGADNPDSLRGVRIDLCIFDEVAFIDKWQETWKVIRPTLADTKADCWFISTPNGFNHFKDLSEMTGDDWIYFHFTSYDNPYLPKEEIEAAREESDEDSFAQEWLGEFRKMSGLIYKMFTRETHMVEIPKIDSNWTYTRTLDFGFVHKTALVYFAISPHGEAIYAYDGTYLSGLTEHDIAEIVKTKDVGKVITNPLADSAQPMSIEALSREGAEFDPVEKGQDSVKNGIVKVAQLLKIRADTGKPTLMFNKDLNWIADEFEQYRWMENKSSDGAIKEVPLKRNDDAMDAIRYFAMNYDKPMKQELCIDDPVVNRLKGWY